VVQLIVFVFARMLMPGLTDAIAKGGSGSLSQAIFLAAVSIAVGMLNAAALVY
jgi:uncharacterized membrane protein YjfL (UPF0719 family)